MVVVIKSKSTGTVGLLGTMFPIPEHEECVFLSDKNDAHEVAPSIPPHEDEDTRRAKVVMEEMVLDNLYASRPHDKKVSSHPESFKEAQTNVAKIKKNITSNLSLDSDDCVIDETLKAVKESKYLLYQSIYEDCDDSDQTDKALLSLFMAAEYSTERYANALHHYGIQLMDGDEL